MQTDEIRALLARPWVHGQATDLRGVTVQGRLDLRGMAVCGVDFTGARFEGPVLAAGARFDGLSWFSGCTFGAADFSGALFVNDARFDGARFAAPPVFARAEFRGIARFDHACLPGGEFGGLLAYGNAAMTGLRIEGPARFDGAEFLGGLWADGATLHEGVSLSRTEVHGRLWLKGARRGNRALAGADFGLVFGAVAA